MQSERGIIASTGLSFHPHGQTVKGEHPTTFDNPADVRHWLSCDLLSIPYCHYSRSGPPLDTHAYRILRYIGVFGLLCFYLMCCHALAHYFECRILRCISGKTFFCGFIDFSYHHRGYDLTAVRDRFRAKFLNTFCGTLRYFTVHLYRKIRYTYGTSFP